MTQVSKIRREENLRFYFHNTQYFHNQHEQKGDRIGNKQEMEITVHVNSHSSIEHERTCLLSERIESIAVQRRGKDNVGARTTAAFRREFNEQVCDVINWNNLIFRP